MGSKKLTNVLDPTANQDAATKVYVDSAITGIGIGNYLPLAGGTMTGQIVSTLAIGTSPFAVTSTTVNTNLNADLWDGYQFSDYLNQAAKTTSSPVFAGLTLDSLSGVLKATSGVVSAATAGTDYQYGLLTTGRLPFATGTPATLTDTSKLAYSTTTNTLTMNTGQLAITGTSKVDGSRSNAIDVITATGGIGSGETGIGYAGGGYSLTGGLGGSGTNTLGGTGGSFLFTGGSGGASGTGTAGDGGNFAAIGGFIGSPGSGGSAGNVYLGRTAAGVERGSVYIQSLSGLLKGTSGVVSAITDNSANWNTAYTDRLKWDGGATDLVVATGRTSLGLGVADTPSFTGLISGIDAATNTAGTLKLWSAGANNYSTLFTAGTQTADASYTLPTASTDGLLRNTSGAWSWITDNSATWNAAQAGDATLTYLAALASGTGFVKQTTADNFANDAFGADNYIPFSNATGFDYHANLTFDGSLLRIGGTAGVNLSAATGKLTIAGVGNTNNENLTLDLETTANTAIIGTGTGVTNISLGALNLNTTGYAGFGSTAAVNTTGLNLVYSNSTTIYGLNTSIQYTGSGSAWGVNCVNYGRGPATAAASLNSIGGQFVSFALDRAYNACGAYTMSIIGGLFQGGDYSGKTYTGTSGKFRFIGGNFAVPTALGTWTGNPNVETYGILIDAVPTGFGTAATHWSLYSTSGNNYFGGNVGIGKTPTVALDVTGAGLIANDTTTVTTLKASKNVATVSADIAVANFIQDSATGACEVLRLQQDDTSEEFIDFVGTDGGATGADSGASVIVALSGTKYKLKLYALS
jgi:hypothetical protein